MNRRFDIIDHTADIGIIAYGNNLNDVFINAAYGMFSLITNPDTVQQSDSRKCDIKAADTEALLVAWLNELLYLFDTEHMVFSGFEVDTKYNNSLSAKCYGNKIDPNAHDIIREIKAATYHELEILSGTDGISARIIFDI